MMWHFGNITRLLLFANSELPLTSALKSCVVMQDVIVCLVGYINRARSSNCGHYCA